MPANQMPSRGTICHQICCKVLDGKDIYKFNSLVHDKLVAAGVREEGGRGVQIIEEQDEQLLPSFGGAGSSGS